MLRPLMRKEYDYDIRTFREHLECFKVSLVVFGAGIFLSLEVKICGLWSAVLGMSTNLAVVISEDSTQDKASYIYTSVKPEDEMNAVGSTRFYLALVIEEEESGPTKVMNDSTTAIQKGMTRKPVRGARKPPVTHARLENLFTSLGISDVPLEAPYFPPYGNFAYVSLASADAAAMGPALEATKQKGFFIQPVVPASTVADAAPLRWIVRVAKPHPSRQERQQDVTCSFEKRDFSDTTSRGFFDRKRENQRQFEAEALSARVNASQSASMPYPTNCQMPLPRAIACGVNDPFNIGGLLRICAFFGVRFEHLRLAVAGYRAAKFWETPEVMHKVLQSSCGGNPNDIANAAAQFRRNCRVATTRKKRGWWRKTWWWWPTTWRLWTNVGGGHLRGGGGDTAVDDGSVHARRGCPLFNTSSLQAYLAYMEKPQRPPIVVIETAATAVPLHEFKFPPPFLNRHSEGQATEVGTSRQEVGGNYGFGLDIVVGGENMGVHRKLLTKLRKGYDSIVFVEKHGQFASMNVVTALSVVLYEYRRQYPRNSEG